MKKGMRFFVFLVTLSLLMTAILPVCATEPEGAVEVIKSDRTRFGWYATPEAALKAAVKAGITDFTIRLHRDFENPGTTTLYHTAAVSYTLDGNGHTIASTGEGLNTLEISGNKDASLTIKNLIVRSHGTAVSFSSGKLVILSGVYYTDTIDLEQEALLVKAAKDSEIDVAICGGSFIVDCESEDHFDVVNFSNAQQVPFRAAIYGGYFYGNIVKFTIGVYDYSHVEVYGGTFYNSKSTGYALIVSGITADDEAILYGGNYRTPDTNTIPVVRNNKDKCLLTVNGGNYMGGNSVCYNAQNKDASIYYSAGVQSATVGHSAPIATVGAAVCTAPGSLGIGFEAKIDRSTAAYLTNLADENTEIRLGMLICDADDLEDLPYFSLDAVAYEEIAYANILSDAVADIAADVTFRGGLKNVKEQFKNVKFTAIPYAVVTIDGYDTCFYGLWDREASYSMSEIAALAIADTAAGYTEAQLNALALYAD